MLPSLRERVPDPSLAEDAECQRIAGKTMEMTVIGVIVAAVVVLFTIPMLWLWVSDRRKRRRRRKLTKDLEGSTAASIKHEKLLKSADPFLYGDTTLAASVSNQPPIVKQKHGKRVERPTKAVTAEQVLGIDKASCLRDIAPGNGGPSPLLTAAPAHMPAGKHELETAGTDAQYINPWEVEYYPNPVLFPHLQDQPNASGSLEHDSYAKLQGIEYPLESDLQAVSLARSVQSAESNSDSPVSSTSSNPTSYASLKTPPIEMKQPTAVMSLPRGRTSDTSNSALLNVSKDIHLQHQCQVCGMECKTPGQLKYVHSLRSTGIYVKLESCTNITFSPEFM
ncbi:Nn.00g039390.m01.CDS01 [Neocucurbitaria sp. VM-36]